MAYDPEAREQSNSAMVIAVVALVIVALGALAWFATRPGETPVVENQTTIDRRTETVTEVPVPTNDAPDTVVVQPSNPAPATPPSTRTETQVTITPPANSGSEPAPSAPAPEAPPAGDGAASGDSSTSSSGY